MKLSGKDIATHPTTPGQDVVCPWCLTATRIELGPHHRTNDVTFHCRKCSKFSRVATSRWDEIQERMEREKTVWKRIPSDAYLTCRQGTQGTPWTYTIFFGGTKPPVEYRSRDSVTFALQQEYGMSKRQAEGAITTAVLTPGYRVYLQRHTRLVMASLAETNDSSPPLKKISAGTPIRAQGKTGVFIRYIDDNRAVVAFSSTHDDNHFTDSEIPVTDIEVLETDSVFDKYPYEDESVEVDMINTALSDLESASDILEELYKEEVIEGDEEEREINTLENSLTDIQRVKERLLPLLRDEAREHRAQTLDDIKTRIQTIQKIIHDPNIDPETLRVLQKEYVTLKKKLEEQQKTSKKYPLSIEDIRSALHREHLIHNINTEHLEKDYIGKPRLLYTASERYEQWLREKKLREQQQMSPKRNPPREVLTDCTCGAGYDPYCPPHGAKESRAHVILSKNDFAKHAYADFGVFTHAKYRGKKVLVVAVDNTSLFATVEFADGSREVVPVSELQT